MIDLEHNSNCCIFQEMDTVNQQFWFDFKQKKFLHNIDTFYYSVKMLDDFTANTDDAAVINFRNTFSVLKDKLSSGFNDSVQFFVPGCGNLNLLLLSFAHMYNIWLQLPDEFDIIIAPVVPAGKGGVSVTSEIIVQLRSHFIWLYGINEAFERSYKWVAALADMFHLSVGYTQENRIDYCWHTNYFLSPAKFFNPDNFYKMRVDRYRDASFHTVKAGTDDYDLDYVALGRRGMKTFVRIYLKSKEVIEMGYKPFFFQVWLLNGLINRYDFYVYEECYKQKSWQYLTIARLKWYLENGSNETYKDKARYIIEQYELYSLVGDDVRTFADRITPKVNMIINVEFQTMRKGTKSYALVPFKDNSSKLHNKRIYDYLDNHAIIIDYLTSSTLRLTCGDDKNKSRRPDCPFWVALRRTKLVDCVVNEHDVKLIRIYERKLNKEVVKRRFINTAVSLGFYLKGDNEDAAAQDILDSLNVLNDNDLAVAMRYKDKKRVSLSSDLKELQTDFTGSDLSIVDNSGEIFDRDNIINFFGGHHGAGTCN